jgi:hypothetical protein
MTVHYGVRDRLKMAFGMVVELYIIEMATFRLRVFMKKVKGPDCGNHLMMKGI